MNKVSGGHKNPLPVGVSSYPMLETSVQQAFRRVPQTLI